MDQLDHDHNVYASPNAGDETLLVKFYIDAMQDHAASKDAGRPIFKDVEWVSIHTPGSRDGVVRPARPADITRFPKHYEAFKARIGKDGEAMVGTPLSTWPWDGMTRSRVEELKYFKVRTVEQLAGMADVHGQKMMGFQQMKQAAKAYLESVKSTAPIARLTVQLEQAMSMLAEQGLEIARLHAKHAGLPEPQAADVTVPLRAQIERELESAAVPQAKPKPAKRSHKKKQPPKPTPGY